MDDMSNPAQGSGNITTRNNQTKNVIERATRLAALNDMRAAIGDAAFIKIDNLLWFGIQDATWNATQNATRAAIGLGHSAR